MGRVGDKGSNLRILQRTTLQRAPNVFLLQGEARAKLPASTFGVVIGWGMCQGANLYPVVSPPTGSLNCAAFVAGIIEGFLNGTQFVSYSQHQLQITYWSFP